MHVRVLCDRKIALGRVGIEDIYDDLEIVEVVFHFHEDDLRESCRIEFGEMLNRQAKAWAQRVTAPAAEWHPVEVLAVCDPHLPPGVEVLIGDADAAVTYLFAPDAIADPARRSFERMMQARIPAWCRVGR
jgi:hypothetical protein